MHAREFTFALLVDGFDVHDDQQIEALYAHGVHDATVEGRGAHALVTFYREACAPDAALWSAISDLRAVAPGCRVLRVDDQLVNAADIADQTDRTPESIRQLAAGSRGPGGFPTPAGVVGNGVKIWRWAEVQPWLAANGIAAEAETLPLEVIADANAELSRQPTPHHPRPVTPPVSSILLARAKAAMSEPSYTRTGAGSQAHEPTAMGRRGQQESRPLADFEVVA